MKTTAAFLIPDSETASFPARHCIFHDDKMYTVNVLFVIITFFSYDPVPAVHL